MLPILSLILSALVFLALILCLVLKPAAARRLSAVFMTIAVVGGLIVMVYAAYRMARTIE